MGQLQVLVATMNQGDFSIVEKMNIACDVVIANQADREVIEERVVDGCRHKMITTKTRGVGLNRNIGLLSAEAEYILFSDDDVVYCDGMQNEVIKAFEENPQADLLIFGMDIVKNGVVTEKRHLKSKRLHLWNAMRFGTYTIAARRSAILRGNITFHQLFGGGCMYSAGEDTLFLKSCFDQGLRVYSHEYVLGTCCKDTSSWFTGYGEKYFYDKGVLVRHLFPRMHYLMAFYFALHFKRETKLSALQRLKLVLKGVRQGMDMKPYRG